ncbi:unnamed protein product [Larinioides sclopetarius]|uniref:Uncharacterized protein n=1 Tax=Larinioides sclopetarius TaxID=280406 RepID=A0AAV2AZQ1_9ARAC
MCCHLWERDVGCFEKIITEWGNLQLRWWPSRLLAWDLRLLLHRHHREVHPGGRQMEEAIHNGEKAETTNFRNS